MLGFNSGQDLGMRLSLASGSALSVESACPAPLHKMFHPPTMHKHALSLSLSKSKIIIRITKLCQPSVGTWRIGSPQVG